MLWAIPKPLAPMVRVLNVLSATAGIAVARRHRIVLNWVMIKIAPEQGRAEAGKPATANINLALAILVINTPAPAPVTPAAPALLVVVSILNAIAQAIIFGMAAVVFSLAHQLTNTLAPAPAIPVAPVLLAAANTPHAPAPAAMSGKTEAAR